MGAPVVSGIPSNFPVRVFETDVNQVSAGTPAGGWVSGTLANLAANSTATAIFDLGQDWHQYPLIAVTIRPAPPSTGLQDIQASFGDTAAFNPARRCKEALSAGLSAMFATMTTSSGTYEAYFRTKGRYFAISMLNSDATNAQGATGKVTLATYPD